MRRFARLYAELDASTSTRRKLEALREWFAQAAPADAAWGAYFLMGGKPSGRVSTRVLREAALEVSGIAPWLFEECYAAAGDLAETIAHLVPAGGELAQPLPGLAHWVEEVLLPLRALEEPAARAALQALWQRLDGHERFVTNKLLTGGLRVGVSRQLVLRALSEVHGLDPGLLAQRLIGFTDGKRRPEAARWRALMATSEAGGDPEGCEGQNDFVSRPYPFFLAHPLDREPESLGDPCDWQVEWKWDGMRAQLVRRGGRLWVWSRGEELIEGMFPELEALAAQLPEGTVLDGEILVWPPGESRPASFAVLQTRLGRRRPGAARLRDTPACFVAYDLLEKGGEDLRAQPLARRRAMLEALLASCPAAGTGLRLSACVEGDWDARRRLRGESRARGVEGFMLKRRDSAYGLGRSRSDARGDWWKWKVDPWSVDAVLVYAQHGHGRRAGLLTDYTFAVWDASRRLVPFAKAYTGLTDAEIREVDARLRAHTLEKFGPVRSVQPMLVFEIGFEGIAPSKRHKAGVAVRLPRILRWRTDKTIEAADTLERLQALLRAPE